MPLGNSYLEQILLRPECFMLRIRRPTHLFFSLADREVVDLGQLLTGQLEIQKLPRVLAMSIASQETQEVEIEDIHLLAKVPTESWTSSEDITLGRPTLAEQVDRLIERGLLFARSGQEEESSLSAFDRRLEELAWHPVSALFHFLDPAHREIADSTPSQRPSSGQASEKIFTEMVERFGPPPPAFHHRPEAQSSMPLPSGHREGQLYRLLLERSSCRAFDPEHPMSKDELATLLFYSFGCQSTSELSPEVHALRRCSPSGGSLHPVEAYPVVAQVDGMEAGCYHYNAEKHSLDLLRPLPQKDIGDLLVRLAGKQRYARGAQVLILLTARFHRNFWKYRVSTRTYGVLLMDAAHISQNLYLVATELGLGGIFSGAIGGPSIEALLGLDPAEEGAVAAFACGKPAAGLAPTDLRRTPFAPRHDG